MTAEQLPHERAAFRLLDFFRGAGLSRGSRLAFRLTYEAWRLAGTSEGKEQWSRLLESSSFDAPAALMSMSADLADERNRLSALSSQSVRSALLLVDQFYAIHGRPGLRELAEAVVSAQAESGGAMGEYATPRWVADLMAELVGPARDAFDPAAGVGYGLLAMAQRGSNVWGVDVNEEAVFTARARLEMAGASARVESGDSLQEAAELGGLYDAVVVAPPLGLHLSDGQRQGLEQAGVPPMLMRGRQGLYWLCLAALRLQPGGQAAVLLSEGSTVASSGLEFLLRERIIEGAITLPANFLSNTAVPATLWLVRRPGEAAGRFLAADVSSLAHADGHRRRSALGQDEADMIVDLVRRFREGDDLEAPNHVAKAFALEEINLNRGLTPALFLDEAPPQAEVLPEPAGRLLTGLAIKGYKSFRDGTEVPLAPLTMVYGPNSSGKSSLIQSLLLLKQSLDHPYLLTQGTVADVGSFAGVRNRHEAEAVTFSVEFGAPVWNLPPEGTPDPTRSRRIEFRFQDSGAGRGVLQSCALTVGPMHSVWSRQEGDSMSIPVGDLAPVFGELGAGTFLFPFDTRQSSPSDDEVTVRTRSQRNRKRAEGYANKLARTGIEQLTIEWAGLVPDGTAAPLPRHAAALREASVWQSYVDRTARLVAGPGRELRSILGGLVHLGPLRSAPQRFYSRTGSTGLPGDGRDAVLYLYDHETAIEQVNYSFRKLEIPYELGVIPLGAGGTMGLVGDLVAVSLKDLRSNVTVTPADVGYGISQSMPLIVELSARTKSVICIEQPETHLHPRLQARLADLFIDSTRAEDRANQLIVETHSEHLMLRLQRRIREGDLDPEDLCVLYVDQDEEGAAMVRRLRIDDEGDFIDEWPDGFFEERMVELFGGLE
ncbi:DUF3696 domain-containing protein [Dermacoccus nishinomiyaensis]